VNGDVMRWRSRFGWDGNAVQGGHKRGPAASSAPQREQ